MVGETFKAENPFFKFFFLSFFITLIFKFIFFLQSFMLFLPHTPTGEEMFTGSFLHYDSAVVLLSAELP